MNYAALNAQSWHTSVSSLWSPGSQLKFMSATAKNVLCCWYYWRIGCQHSCLKDRNRKRKTRKHYNFAGQYLSLHCSHAGSFSRRRNCVIHGSLVNSKAEIIGRLIMLGAWYIAKVIRHLGRLNHCVNEFGTLTLDSSVYHPAREKMTNWSWAVPSLEGLECDLEIIVQAKL